MPVITKERLDALIQDLEERLSALEERVTKPPVPVSGDEFFADPEAFLAKRRRTEPGERSR